MGLRRRGPAAEQRLGAAQRSGEARWDGRGRGSGGNLLVDIGRGVAQSSGVPGGADPELLELVLGVSQLVFEETKTVWGRSRGWSSMRRRLRGFPHAVCHAAVGPTNCLRSRGRGEGDEGRGRVGARLGDQEGPNQQAGETPLVGPGWSCWPRRVRGASRATELAPARYRKWRLAGRSGPGKERMPSSGCRGSIGGGLGRE